MRRQAAFLFSGGVFVVAFAALVALGTWLRGPAPIEALPRRRIRRGVAPAAQVREPVASGRR
jgi:hypothetical protein